MKTVLITGATRGIGEAIANKYFSNGYYTIGTGTKQFGSFSFLDEYHICDFTNKDQLEYLISILPGVDILINNVGINKISNFLDISSEDFLQTQQVNLYSPFRLSQAVLPNMLNNNWGRIINIASIWSKLSKIGRASYSASKFGLEGMSIALSHEVCSSGVLVNCVSPGFVDTDLTRTNLGSTIGNIISTIPQGRLATPEEIANTVFWLGSEQNTFITGQNIFIDGGFTVA